MGDDQPDYTMRERVGSRWDKARLQVLLNANRMALTGVVTVGMFVSFLLLGAATPFRQYMLTMGPTRYMFQALVGALITGVTLVVTIAQLVLSQEIGPLGGQRERMSDAMSFRGDVEESFGSISPPEPEAFLQALIANSREKAEAFRDAVDGTANGDLQEDVDQFTDHLADHADIVVEKLDGKTFGEYAVVEAALDYNYAEKIYQARRVRDRYGDDLSEDERRALVDLLHVLSFFGPAREYIKNLYFQWELVDLSRNIIYTTIPALVVTGSMAIYLSPSMFQGSTLGISDLVWVTSAGVTAGFVPFVLLSTYILRLATIAKRTLAIGPFILRDSERSSDIEWE
ncbi:hypothetical protein [Natronomonas salina]|uniref:hypothetical protein n=1 Tax=Natronomonas salina TaxID=1710540 RepID=UPI001FEB3EBC|nr:hypothetical protein [Natronomonas salina]